MRLSSLTAVGFCANTMLDRREQAPFTIDELHKAVEKRDLMPLLSKIDDSGVIELFSSNPQELAEVNSALCAAGETFYGQSMRKAGVGENALCFVMAYVLEAIQQKFR